MILARMRARAADALGALLAVVLALPAFVYPFGNDQALHWYLGKRWLEGEVPFVSGISSKPVVIFAVHALSTALLGDGMWPIRITEAITILLVSWCIAALAEGSLRPRPGAFGRSALLLAGSYYPFFDYWDTAHPELWEGSFIVLACAVAALVKRPALRDFGAGALASLAFMTKFPAALPALAIGFWCLSRAHEGRGPSRVRAVLVCIGWIAAGSCSVVALCVLPFVVADALGPMWEILYDFVRVYAEQARHDPSMSEWQSLRRGGGLLLATGFAVVACLIAAARERHRAALGRVSWLSLVTALAAGGVVVQGRYFGYHWVVVVPMCAALLSMFFHTFAGRIAGLGEVALAACLVAIVLAAGPRWETPRDHDYVSHARSALDYVRGDVSRAEYLRPFRGRARLDDFGLMERVAARVLRHAGPHDTLCARGFATPLYPLTGMRCTTRHIVQEIVDQGLPGWPAEYRTALAQRPPTFMITFSDRPRDVSALRARGYRSLGNEGKFLVMMKRPDARR